MNNLQQLQDNFWRTRVEAKAAYKKWKSEENAKDINWENLHMSKGIYNLAWQFHIKASMALFLAEVEEE